MLVSLLIRRTRATGLLRMLGCRRGEGYLAAVIAGNSTCTVGVAERPDGVTNGD